MKFLLHYLKTRAITPLKREKEASSLQDPNKGIQIQNSPQSPSSQENQIDDDEVLDQENQEHSDQEIPGNIDSTNGPTFANKVWTVVEKNKKVDETPQPMVRQSQARKPGKKTSSSPSS
jgi:hypothetical protein